VFLLGTALSTFNKNAGGPCRPRRGAGIHPLPPGAPATV